MPPAYSSGRNSARYVNQQQQQKKQPNPTAWDKDPVPENLPAPSARYQQQNQQYERDMKEAYKAKSARNVTEVSISTAREMRGY